MPSPRTAAEKLRSLDSAEKVTLLTVSWKELLAYAVCKRAVRRNNEAFRGEAPGAPLEVTGVRALRLAKAASVVTNSPPFRTYWLTRLETAEEIVSLLEETQRIALNDDRLP